MLSMPGLVVTYAITAVVVRCDANGAADSYGS